MTTKIYLHIYMVQNQNFDNLRQSEHILSNFYFCEKAQLKQKAKLWLTGTDATRHNVSMWASVYFQAIGVFPKWNRIY